MHLTTHLLHEELGEIGQRLHVGGGAHPGGLGAIQYDDCSWAALKPDGVDQEKKFRAKKAQHSREILWCQSTFKHKDIFSARFLGG